MEEENQMRRSKAGAFFMAAGILLTLSALSLLFYNQLEAWRAGRAADAALAGVAQVQTSESPDIAIPFPGDERVVRMPSVIVDGRAYIGSLSIPALELELPVLADWDFESLDLAPCRFHGSIVTDDLVIAGHNYQSHFAGVEKLRQNDEVAFVNMEGDELRYRVSALETLAPSETEKMIESDGWDLTLFTCTYTGEARVAVRCTREDRLAI
jgi:sortase A